MASPILARTVRRIQRIMPSWRSRRDHPEAHPSGGFAIREVVFGANDGLVSNVALVAGLAGGTSDARIIVLGGVAGLVAGSISMAPRRLRLDQERGGVPRVGAGAGALGG